MALRIIRYASLLLICALASFYASVLLLSERPGNIVAGEDLAKPAAAPATKHTNPLQRLPEFSLVDLHGQTHFISEWADRPLLINFWATWCAPCLREMPMLQTLQQERKDKPLEVIGIAIDRLNAVETFINENGVTYPILVGQTEAMEAAEQFGDEFVALPFTVFTAPGGDVLYLHSGELHLEQLREILSVTDQVTDGRITADEARERLNPRQSPSTG
jgi:thiol-disulfide isomerase/thioredoxin